MRRVEHAVLALPAALCLVEGHVRLAEQLVRGVAAGRPDGDADAHVHAHALAGHLDAVLEVAQQPLRDRDGVRLAACAVEQQRELVAAEAGGGVALAEASAQAVGHRAQQLVAGVVSVAVVDRLELVDVEQQHAHARAAALERVLEAVVEERAVGKLGERVVERLALELVAGGTRAGAPPARGGRTGAPPSRCR